MKKIKGNTNFNTNLEKISADVSNFSEKDIDEIKDFISPIYNVQRLNVDDVEANDYNPNSVADPEMELLATSILEDGYTQPIVVVPNEEKPGKYIIVDGFHRWTLAKYHDKIRKREKGTVPAVVIKKSKADRIASTIRHNRARGTHNIDVMASIVNLLVESGLGDDWIAKNLGLEKEELLRMKQISGIADVFSNEEYSEAWTIDLEEGIECKYKDDLKEF